MALSYGGVLHETVHQNSRIQSLSNDTKDFFIYLTFLFFGYFILYEKS